MQRFSPKASSVLEKKVFKGFYHIWEGQLSWSVDHHHFSNLSFPQLKEATYEIRAKLAQQLQRRSRLKMLTDERTDRCQTKSDHYSSSWAWFRWAKKDSYYFNRLAKQFQFILFPKETMGMKCQGIFPGINKKKIMVRARVKFLFMFNIILNEKQEDHDGPISLTWANSFAYLLLKFQPSSLL